VSTFDVTGLRTFCALNDYVTEATTSVNTHASRQLFAFRHTTVNRRTDYGIMTPKQIQ